MRPSPASGPRYHPSPTVRPPRIVTVEENSSITTIQTLPHITPTCSVCNPPIVQIPLHPLRLSMLRDHSGVNWRPTPYDVHNASPISPRTHYHLGSPLPQLSPCPRRSPRCCIQSFFPNPTTPTHHATPWDVTNLSKPVSAPIIPNTHTQRAPTFPTHTCNSPFEVPRRQCPRMSFQILVQLPFGLDFLAVRGHKRHVLPLWSAPFLSGPLTPTRIINNTTSDPPQLTNANQTPTPRALHPRPIPTPRQRLPSTPSASAFGTQARPSSCPERLQRPRLSTSAMYTHKTPHKLHDRSHTRRFRKRMPPLNLSLYDFHRSEADLPRHTCVQGFGCEWWKDFIPIPRTVTVMRFRGHGCHNACISAPPSYRTPGPSEPARHKASRKTCVGCRPHPSLLEL